MITHLEPDILKCEVKWAIGNIITNKASGGDGIPAELFQIQKYDAVKVLHSICQQIWKTQQWSQDCKMMGGSQEGGDMGVPMADSFRCMTENPKILGSNYPSINK